MLGNSVLKVGILVFPNNDQFTILAMKATRQNNKVKYRVQVIFNLQIFIC